MKKNIRRILALLLALAIVVCCAACTAKEEEGSDEFEYSTITITDNTSSDDTDSKVTDSKVESDTPSTGSSSKNPSTSSGKKPTANMSEKDKAMSKMPKKLRGTTLTYMYWFDAKTQMEKPAIEAFEKETGIKVKTVVASYSDFQAELNTRIASGNAPDLVRQLGNQQWMVKNLQPITNSGYDFASDSAWDQWIMKQYTFNGKCYAANIKNSAILDVALIYYNKKALKAADMDNDDPYKIWKKNPKNWTWEKFWSMCDEFVKANGSKAEYYGSTFQYYEAYIRAMGGANWYYDANKGKYINNSNSSATVEGWKKTLEAYEKKWTKTEYDIDAFERNRILFVWAGPFFARKTDTTSCQALKKSNELGIVPLPTDSKHNTLYEMTAFGIPVGAKNAAAAPYYIRYVMDRSSYNWNNIYYNAQAKEVVDYVVDNGNFFYGHSEVASLRSAMLSGGSAQAKNILKAHEGVIDQAVQDENNAMTYLPK